MRITALCLLLAGCALPLGQDAALRLGFDGQVRHRANAAQPRWYVGLRLSLIRGAR